jgi:hypothetical protein
MDQFYDWRGMNALCHGFDFFRKRAIGAHDDAPCARRTRMFVDSWGNGYYCHDCVVPFVGYGSYSGIENMCGAGQKMCVMERVTGEKTDDIDRQVCQD